MKRAGWLTELLFLGAGSLAWAEIRYTAGSLRDPFSEQYAEKPVDEGALLEESLKKMDVQGMVLSGQNTYAIINGKIYHVGNMLGAAKIVNIDKTGVTASYRNKQILIPMLKRKTTYDIPKAK